jgi:hypothetical protein
LPKTAKSRLGSLGPLGVKDALNALMTLKKILEQRPNVVMPCIKNVQTLKKQIEAWRVEKSHQTTIDSFFQRALMFDENHIFCTFILYFYKCYVLAVLPL